jgi:hypothetical protein
LSTSAHGLHRALQDRTISMSISSVTTTPPPLPPQPPQPVQPTPPQPDQDDSSSAPAQAPLPPGQGTRVNIIA